jgi:hypothetical protein
MSLPVTSPLADALAAKADALRDVYNAGERLLLFRQAESGVKTGLELIGEFTGSWQKERRRFERGEEQLPAIVCYFDDTWTPEALSVVAAFGVFTDEDAIVRDKCRTEGVARFGDEIGMRLRSTGRLAGAYALPVDDVDSLLLASGDNLLLVQGGNLLLGGA